MKLPPPTRTTLGYELPISYLWEPAVNQESPGVLILHGFSDRGPAARKRILGLESHSENPIFSPNGAFPVPSKTKDGVGYREAYAWYFRDPHTGTEMISPEFAAEGLRRLLDRLHLPVHRWIVVGFSQGGFLAPYLVRAGIPVSAIIAVGAAFRTEAFQGLPALRLHAIHGKEDDVISAELSQSSFEKIRTLGYAGEYHLLSGLKHTLNSEGREILRGLLAKESQL